ncbi:MAG: hypothetical protein GXP40_10260, partial [Chloroflexi bacterium]|nr:hypothetical protein [Chloroflexota bacterium]
SLATLLAGLPLWMLTWRPMQAEALTLGDVGDHARRSIVRKVYLYFVLFSGVVGGMAAAVRLAFLLFSTLLGARPEGFANEFLDVLQVLALFAGLLVYHWQVLRRDGAQATQALANKHALFPVMVFDPGDGTFAREVAAALEKQAPRLSLTVQRIGEAIPDEARAHVKAVILPGNLAVEPPEALRLWLRDFNGSRLIVPLETPGWLWTGGIRQAAQAVRQLAEGEDPRLAAKSPGWMIAVYVLAGMMGLEIVFILLVLVISAF